MHFKRLVSPKLQAPTTALEKQICVKYEYSHQCCTQRVGSPQTSLWMHLLHFWSCPKSNIYSEVTSYPQRTSRGLRQAFFVQIKQRGQSNRIREHTGVLSTVARKKVFHFQLKFERVRSLWQVCIKCSAFPILIFEITTNSVVSRGMTKCISVAVLVLITMGHQNYQRVQEELLLALSHALRHKRTVLHTSRNTQITPVTAPIRNGYFFIKQIPLVLWKREVYSIQTLKKVKSRNCHNTALSVFTPAQ